MKNKKKKIFVGMSGGVDSSLTAALLKNAGHNITGVFIKVWHPDFLPCTWKKERIDAMRVAAKLNIPFVTLDLEKEYKEGVVDYMIREYTQGRTPNPDVMCNKMVKFGAFLNYALGQGADAIATGHYARVFSTKDGYSLHAGMDKNKDQSYFLWQLGQRELSRTLFPIGEYKKTEVRALAEKFQLPTAQKKDSQGLCFVGKVNMIDFLKHFIDVKGGTVLNASGEIIGKHEGAVFYTLGQRHGFLVTKKTPGDTPYYVVSRDIDRNTITVSHQKDVPDATGNVVEVSLEDTNWISEGKPVANLPVQMRYRYRQPLLVGAIQNATETKATALFKEPQPGFPRGQSLVFYRDDECIGGGVIT